MDPFSKLNMQCGKFIAYPIRTGYVLHEDL